MMFQRKSTALVLALTVLTLGALVATEAFARPGAGHGDRGRGLLPPADYLDLTEEQQAAAKTIFGGVREQLGGQREARMALHQELREALDAPAPDAQAIGELVIEMHGLRGQFRTVLEAADSEFSALLTADQLDKWEHFKELRQRRRGHGPHRGGAGDGLFGPDGSDAF